MKAWKTESAPEILSLPAVEVLNEDSFEYDKYVSKVSNFQHKKKKIKKSTKNKNQVKIFTKCVTVKQNDEFLDSTWLNIGVPSTVAQQLCQQGFSDPTPIQSLCLPELIKLKNDAIVVSETGSGKTLVYAIPIISLCVHLLNSSDNSDSSQKLRCLILTPTRELAIQVKNMINKISRPLGVFCVDIIGGLSELKQERMLNKHPQIVVGTPGRLWTYFEQTPHLHLRDLSGFKLLIIDEADRMTEQGHFFQLKNILNYIKVHATVKYATFILSATLSLEKKNLRFKTKHSTTIIQKISNILSLASNVRVYDLSQTSFTPKSLNEYKIFCDVKQRDLMLFWILKNSKKSIVFVNSVKTSDYLSLLLDYLSIKSLRIHSKMDQKTRLQLYDEFYTGSCVMIATDVLSRGIDITDVQTIIHYDVPSNPDIYVHRSGRTARHSQTGQSILIVIPESFSRYKTILSTLKRQSDLPEFSIDFNFISKFQPIIDSAINLAKEDSRLKSIESDKRWLADRCKATDSCFDSEYSTKELPSPESLRNLKKSLKISKKKLLNTILSIK